MANTGKKDNKPSGVFHWQNLKDWLPTITIILIALGYLNQHIFYAKFGIPIYNFIDAGEILLLFMPFFFGYIEDISLSLLIVFGLFLIIFYHLKLVLRIDNKVEIKSEEGENIDKLSSKEEYSFDIGIKIQAINKRWKAVRDGSKTYSDFIEHFLFTLLDIVSIVGTGLIWLFILYYRPDNEGYKDSRMEIGLVITVIILFVLSFELFSLNFTKYVLALTDERSLAIFYLARLCFYIILFLYLITENQTLNIKHGQSDYDVKFSYNNKLIKTDTNLIYIGSTQKFIFLRQLNIKATRVFRTDSIGSLTIKKREYKYSWDFITKHNYK